jgi:hypothetical protein
MAKIIEAGDLPLEDKVYLKKDLLGYRVVYPNKNQDGSWNIINLLFGGWNNLLMLIIFVIAILMVLYGGHSNVQQVENFYSNISENPFDYCKKLLTPPTSDASLSPGGSFNISSLSNEG